MDNAKVRELIRLCHPDFLNIVMIVFSYFPKLLGFELAIFPETFDIICLFQGF